ncbi:MAG TPA: sulfotransferase [Thermoanaerobaculia bacterium]|jgi:tetratricopeptide (TPR) repeat protein
MTDEMSLKDPQFLDAEMDPKALDRAVTLCQAGRLGQAEGICRRFIAAQPDHAPALELLGMIRAQRGDFTESLDLLRQACALDPAMPQFHNNLGIVLKKSGQMEAAVASYERALELQPGMTDVLLNLGAVLREMRRTRAAATRFLDALGSKPSSTIAHYYLADVLTQEGGLEEADLRYRRAFELVPGFGEAFLKLGLGLLKVGRILEGLLSLQELVRIRPVSAEAHAALASALLKANRIEAAEQACHRALYLQPGYAAAHNNLGAVLLRMARITEAEACFRKSLELEPHHLDVLINLTAVLEIQGRSDAATECVRQILSRDPDRAEAHYYLASLKTFERMDDPDLLAAKRLAESSPPHERPCFLSFALGKAFDDLEQHDLAFHHFVLGNQAKRQQFPHEPRSDCARAEQVIALFRRDMMAARAGYGLRTRLPIFILGMPRTGKTLVESLLARYPGVHAGGERGIVELGGEDLGPEIGEGLTYPAYVPSMTRDQARGAAERHLGKLRQEAPEAVRVTNTMPGNYMFLGLIHLLFPEAPIIHCTRDPLDTCLCCYFKLFHSGWDFTFDLETLGRNYVAYARVMRHWRELLPGSILEVRYEDMVSDPDAMDRRIARFCGLAGEDERARTRLDRRKATVRRQPSTAAAEWHRREIGRWRQYRSHLGPLEDIVAELYPGKVVPD